MKIFHIFGDRLWSIGCQIEDSSKEDEFSALFETWNDPFFLNDFFHDNKTHLGFFGNPTPADAVRTTRSEALWLQAEFKSCATHSNASLDDIFEPLDNFAGNKSYMQCKCYGPNSKSWLRVYAIKLEPGVYLVTGGCLKLTKTMQGNPHTELHLKRLNKCIEYLKATGITDVSGLAEAANEN